LGCLAPKVLVRAHYIYDGDGNLVKSMVNGVTTYHLGKYYQKQVDKLGAVKEQRYYAAGSQAIAVRTIGGGTETVNWIVSDHLGSTSITANEDGSFNSEIRYSAFGEIRFSNGTTPTNYQYTGQLADSYIKLSWYNTRWYDNYLNPPNNTSTLLILHSRARVGGIVMNLNMGLC
jgi:hypothetical protein